MKKLPALSAIALAIAAIATSCQKPDPKPDPLGEMKVVFAEKAYVVTLGQTSKIDFTVEGIGNATVEVNAIPKKSEWTASATLDKDGKGVLEVTAPAKLALTTIEVEVIDEANSRKASSTISVTANAEGLDPLEIEFSGKDWSVQAGGSALEIAYTVKNLGDATLVKPEKIDIATTLTVDNLTYEAANAAGVITVSCPSTITAESASLKFTIKDSYGRTYEGTITITVIPAPVVEDAYNCYIVKPGESVTFPKYASEVASVELAWQDAKGLIASITVEGDNVKVATAGTAEGNALILGKDSDGKTKWSWHIWATNYNPATDNITINGVTFMTRNLGAVSATPGDAGALGMTYQWGRRDPLPRMTSIVTSGNAADVIYDKDGNEITTKKSSKFYKFKGTAADIAIETTYGIPDYFIERFADTGAWWRVSIDAAKNYWGGEDLKKSVNDPCPKGWKVPAVTKDGNGDPVNPYAFILTDKAVVDVTNYGLTYTDGGKSVWFPCTGERYRTSGLAGRNGLEGNYWTASYNKTESTGVESFWYAQFATSGAKSLDFKAVREVHAGTAIAVRCVKE